MSADNTNPEMTSFETALAGVPPAPARLDRDALMYAAGRRSVGRSRLWPALAGVLAVVSLALGVRSFVVGPRVVEKIVVVSEPAVVPSIDGPMTKTRSERQFETASDIDPEGPFATSFTVNLARPKIEGSEPSKSAANPIAAKVWTAPPIRPLEQDLGLPPGSLREFQPHDLSSNPTRW